MPKLVSAQAMKRFRSALSMEPMGFWGDISIFLARPTNGLRSWLTYDIGALEKRLASGEKVVAGLVKR